MNETGDTPAWLTAGYDRIWMPYTQMQTAPLPQAAVATEGSRITLSDGRELIDGVASWWAACHGYNHPHIVEAIRDQAAKMPHIMLAGLANEPAFTLAQRFAAFAPDPDYRVFFSESGSVSVEVALKIAAQFWHNKGETTRKKFLCFRGGYHGDTFATMALCDPVDGFHAAFQGVVPGQLIADLPQDDATEAALDALFAEHGKTIAAVIVEPLVQGAGGMLFHAPQTLQRLRRLCDAHGLLLVFDEIFAGLGRLGTMLAGQRAGVAPDILTLSKTLTGGTLPLSAIICMRTSLVQSLRSMRSRSRCLFTTTNSPDSTRRLYMLDVKGSMDSLLPRICAVDAVGMGAMSSELRRPVAAIFALSVAQSQRSEGVTPQRSYWSFPWCAGDPSKVSYAPSSAASSAEDSTAPK